MLETWPVVLFPNWHERVEVHFVEWFVSVIGQDSIIFLYTSTLNIFQGWVASVCINAFAHPFRIGHPDLLVEFIGDEFWRHELQRGMNRHPDYADGDESDDDIIVQNLTRSRKWLPNNPGNSRCLWKNDTPSSLMLLARNEVNVIPKSLGSQKAPPWRHQISSTLLDISW